LFSGLRQIKEGLEKTEQILYKALATLEEWRERNNMKINASKTAFQSFSLAHKKFIQG